MRYFWLTLSLAASLLVGITLGWEALLGLWIMFFFVAGVWTIAGWIVGRLLGPQEAHTGPPVYDQAEDADWLYVDPTRPQPHDDDEHPVIVLDNYRYRRTR